MIHVRIPAVGIRLEFDAAHRLQFHKGKCVNIHGHRYTIEASVSMPTFDSMTGMVADFSEIKHDFKWWIDEHLDHGLIIQRTDPLVEVLVNSSIQTKVYLLDGPPTAENILQEIYWEVSRRSRCTIVQARLWETSNSWAEMKAQ